ncbi:putative lysozyme-like protein [Zeugodacus cucurbitae]|uniref:putative lysozyme-like protein n=1 Tax=Zeugodacus cucurbitae TaxID=28588 RepID=UPI0023D8F5B4|nr:putative lysozyme-like protein [Zeugodacus cucurbitae]
MLLNAGNTGVHLILNTKREEHKKPTTTQSTATLAPPVVLSTSNTITIETTTSTASPQHCHSGGNIAGVAVGIGVNVSSSCSSATTANVGLGSIGIGSTLCSSGDSGISSSTPSLVSQLSPPPTIICSLPTSSTNANNSIGISASVGSGAISSSAAAAAGRCSPIISGGSYGALTNGLAGISVSGHTTTTSIYGGGGGGSNNSNCHISNKPKSSLSPLQRLPIGGNLSTYGGGSGGIGGSGPGFQLLTGSNSHLSSISPALSASTPLSSGMSGGGGGVNNATNYLSNMKLLGPASIDLGTTPLSHRNYSTIKGFSFRRSFDDKIIAPLNSSSGSGGGIGGIGVGSGGGGGIGSHSNYLTHHHFHTHFHHPTSAMQKQSSIERHMTGGGGGVSGGVGNIMSHSTHYPLTSSQSSTKLSYRDDFLQQIGYLPTTRIFNTSIDEDRQQEFLSLSMSPPLNRRRDMPALRGIISL